MATEQPTKLVRGAVAIITGGSSGIGRAVALEFAQQGARAVVIADLQQQPREGGTPTDEAVTEFGAKAAFRSCDVSEVGSIAEAIGAADEFGGVTVLVNCAGIFRASNFLEVTETEYDQMMDINVKGTFFACQAVAQSMIAGNRTGSIINLSSIAGLRGGAAYSTYNTSKGAVRMMSYSLAGALSPHGIRVNAVHPGIIRTSMTTQDVELATDAVAAIIPARRIGEAQDVARSICFLASDFSSYVTGSSLVVDGGMTYTN